LAINDKNTPKSSPKSKDRTVLASKKLSKQNDQPIKDDVGVSQSAPRKADAPSRKKPEDATRAVSPGKDSNFRQKPKKTRPEAANGRSDHKSQKDVVETEFTEYNTEGKSSNSSGFEMAKAIANRALATKENILKKRFVLEEVLGEGGMGVVYKARDLRKVEAEDPYPFVAAKVLSQGFKDHPDAFVVMQQEAAKSQRLAHPNIVTVHDFDRDGNTIYLTMELLQGQPLDKLIRSYKKKGIPKEQVIPLFKDLCAALSYAHERQLIHADFKPGNVFISDEGSAKILDFGIARAASKESQNHQYDIGKLGARTPAYSTVEMVQGITPTFSDDVYALACVLYEMLSGKHPYQEKSAAVALKEKIKPKRIAALTSKEWKALSQGLALNRKDRHATVNEFRNAFMPRKKKSLILKVAGILMLATLCVAAWLGYKQQQGKLQLTNTIARKLEQAQACYDRKDYECAIEESLVVTSLAPNNMKARQLYTNATQALKDTQLEKKVDRLLEQAKSCFDKQDLSCAKIKIEEVLFLEPNHIEARAMKLNIEKATHTREISSVVRQGEECIERKDINCALIFLSKAQDLDAGHELTSSLDNKVKTFQERLKTELLNRTKAINLLINKAQDCLSRNDYDCTIEKVKQALKIDSNNIDAIKLKSEAELARKQKQANERKVVELVRQGQECFQKGNFNCAVAKAESALDVLPENDAALKLKKASIDKQNELKQSLKIN
jgi:tetratricopeptide (TPR) repeat protein